MKKLIILTALALPLVFAGCSNEEDFDFAQQKPSQETNTDVVGKIASHGMTVAVGNGAVTRLDGSKWEKGDRLGIAWVNARAAKVNFLYDATGFDASTKSDTDVTTTPYAQAAVTGSGDAATVTFTYDGKATAAIADPSNNYTDTKYYEIVWSTPVQKVGTEWVYGSPITATQFPIDFSNASWTSLTDKKIYANNMFEFDGSGFAYDGDVFEGAYFAYWPYTRLAGIKEMNLALNNKQTVASSQEFYLNNAFSISAIDSIQARDKDGNFVTKSGTSKSFDLVKVANGISVNTAFVGTEDVTDMKIASVTVSTGTKNVFATTATFAPHALPSAVYKADKVTYDAEETLKKMELGDLIGAGKAIVMPATLATSIATEVEMDLSAANTIGLLTFPTATVAVDNDDISIVVEVKDKGAFTITYDATATDANAIANNATILKLVSLLNGTFVEGAKSYSLRNLNTTYFNIPVKLMMSDFAVTDSWEVKVAADWNKAVAEIDALGIKNAEIKLVNDITVENPLFPTNAVLNVIGEKAMTITGKATITKDVTSIASPSAINAMVYNIKNTAELTIAEDAKVTVQTITVDGILNLNGKLVADAKTGSTDDNSLTIAKDVSVAGVMNLGAKGEIPTGITTLNNNIINVTESTTNKIESTTLTNGADAKIVAVITDGANTENVIAKAHATEVTFNGATVDVKNLTKDAVYFTKGNTTFKGTLATAIDTKLTVSEGTLTFAKGTKFTLGNTTTITTVNASKPLTVAKDAKLVIATGDTGAVTTCKVVNNGLIELEKDDKGKVTTWSTGAIDGAGTLNLNNNVRADIVIP